MANIALRVEFHEDSWTVRDGGGLFERFSGARDALTQALRQAERLRRAGHKAEIQLGDRRHSANRRFPKDRSPGGLPPYNC